MPGERERAAEHVAFVRERAQVFGLLLRGGARRARLRALVVEHREQVPVAPWGRGEREPRVQIKHGFSPSLPY